MNRILILLLFLLFSLCSYSANPKGSNGFIENKGQLVDQYALPNPDVLFLYSGNGIRIQLRRSGYSYELFGLNGPMASASATCPAETAAKLQGTFFQNYRVDVDFAGADGNPEVIREQQAPEYLNYYLDGEEITRVPVYSKITYKNVFKHTDLEFFLEEGQNNPFKYNLVLHPGADPDQVKFLVRGASGLSLQNNSLVISTPLGSISEDIPFSYYTDAPAVDQKVNFKLTGSGFSFSTPYDPARTLVIDPSSNLIWSTYYGGSSLDYCTSTGVDAQNNVYIAGHTMSPNNIATSGSYQSTINASLDVYLAKFNAAGVRQWATYMGGSSFEQIFAMHIEPSGGIYVTGDTNSPNAIASPGAQQTTYGGGIDDVLLAKFDQNGLRLWSTYYGNYEHDIAQAVTVDSAGNVIISGHTQSSVGIATSGAYNTTYVFNMDVFVAKFTPSGALLWATYYGDSDVDESFGVACDASDNIYVVGWTTSIAGIATPGSHQLNNNGVLDGFLAKFNPAGTALSWGTYYGGNGIDKCTAVRVNTAGNVVVGGNTASSTDIASPNSYQPVMQSVDEAFLATFTPSGTRLWGTYFGGNDVDYINNIVLDAKSNILFCGQTLSTNSISTTGAYQPTLNTPLTYDAYFAKFSASGSKLLGSYFGGPGNENAQALALDNTGKLYIAGETTSTIGIVTQAAHQTTIGNSGGDGFLSKFCITFEPQLTPAGNSTVCIGSITTLSAMSGYSTYIWTNGYTINPIVLVNSTQGSYYLAVQIDDGYGCQGQSDSIKITVANCYMSLSETAAEEEVLLYPVPSGDMIYLQWNRSSEVATVEIYAANGQLLSRTESSASFLAADISGLSPGVYFACIKDATGFRRRKFIKE
jgi:hypothetical protein